jgi:hypothetical protein
MSVDEEPSSRLTTLSRVRARCDSRMTSVEDSEALNFKARFLLLLRNVSVHSRVSPVQLLHANGSDEVA